MKKVSLKDIAERAGVSTTTVSFVLNGRATEKRISKGVIERVKKIVKELDYKPNQMARGLRTGKTKTLGLMVEDISNPFFARLAKTIEDAADQHGYEVIFCSTEDDGKRAARLLRMLHYRQVDGYILTPTICQEPEISQLLKETRPVVLVDRYFSQLPSHYVVVDNFQGAYLATEHLLNQGFKKIALVTTASRQLQMEQRREGFLQALRDKKARHAKQRALTLPFNENPNTSLEAIRSFLKKAKPDAIFFSTNYLAIFGLQVIKQLGWRIPEDIGLISFDDHDVFRLYDPPITCVAQPISLIGQQVVSILMQTIHSKIKEDLQQFVLEPELIVRASCREQLPEGALS